MDLKEYYSRKDVQEELLRQAQDREVQAWFGAVRGRRPEVIHFPGDLNDLIKQGMTSFHISEERWHDPLTLKPGLAKKELDNLRRGWDACVPGFEKIFAFLEGEFIASDFKSLTETLNLKGYGRFLIPECLQVFSVDPSNLKIQLDRVEEFIIRPSKLKELLIKIKVEDGRIIYVSQDHPVLVFTSNGIVSKKATDLTLQDYLVEPLNLPSLFDSSNSINLLAHLSKIFLKYVHTIRNWNQELSRFYVGYSKEFKRFIPILARSSLKRDSLPLNVYLDLIDKKLLKSLIDPKISFLHSKHSIPFTIPLNYQFGKLLGYYLSEGSLDDARIEFVFSAHELHEAQEVVSAIHQIFSTKIGCSIKKHKTENSLKVRVNSKLLEILFKEVFQLGTDSYTKNIPSFLLTAPEEFLIGLITSCFHGDGHIRNEWNIKSVRAELFTSSNALVHALSFILLRLGVHHNLRIKNRSNLLKISGSEGIKRMASLSPEFLQKSGVRLGQILINHPSKHTSYPPFFDIQKVRKLKDRIKKLNLYRAIRLNQRTNSILIQEVMNSTLKKAISNHIFPIKIKSIQLIQYGQDYYDLKTSKNHNFMHGFNIFTHNCLDLDSKELNYSLFCAELLIEALKFHDIKNHSLKFSGNHGFHIAIPFEAFPDEVNGVPIKDYFPDGVRIIAAYLKDMIKDHLTAKILQGQTIEQAAVRAGKTKEDAMFEGKFNPFALVDIDSVLVSNRHLFRAAYSVNEKSGLVSIPLKSIKDFNKDDAKPENVKVTLKFLDRETAIKGEARQLLVQAFDWAMKKQQYAPQELPIKRIYEAPKNAIDEKHFPPCMKLLLSGIKEDGRKRAVFILINFLSNMGWAIEYIETYLLEWNRKNHEPLLSGYIKTQIDWFRRQNKKVLPANCDNPAYYKALGVCQPDEMCKFIKNPVNYALRKSRLEENNRKKKTKVSSSKRIKSDSSPPAVSSENNV